MPTLVCENSHCSTFSTSDIGGFENFSSFIVYVVVSHCEFNLIFPDELNVFSDANLAVGYSFWEESVSCFAH